MSFFRRPQPLTVYAAPATSGFGLTERVTSEAASSARPTDSNSDAVPEHPRTNAATRPNTMTRSMFDLLDDLSGGSPLHGTCPRAAIAGGHRPKRGTIRAPRNVAGALAGAARESSAERPRTASFGPVTAA